MKHVILALAALLVTTQANARSMYRYLNAEIQHVRLAEGSHLAQLDITGGNVQVDFMNQEVTLKLQPAYNCPESAACALVMPAPVEITLPIINVERTTCGTRIFRAKKDLRPVDGDMKEIIIIDNKGNTCPTLVMLPATEVTLREEGYDRMGQSSFEFVHSFIAGVLRP